MKNLITLLLLSSVSFNYSCQTKKEETPDLKGLVEKFADLECRAVTLREQRFELANQLRYTQDTLLKTTNATETTRLKLKLETFSKHKEILLNQSLALADSIKHSLDYLMQNNFTTPKDKQAFNDQLTKTLEARGCGEKL